jgi:uncharacterized protein (DUF1499 family)
MLKKLLVLVVLAGAGVAVTAWPRINSVETGRTPEYPDLQPREYRQSEKAVAEAARSVVEGLPRWRLVGSGRGPGGTAIHALATTLVLRFQDDVTIRIRRKAGKTQLSVRSSSRAGKWDFGQNARNIRKLLAALDARLGV